MRKQAHIKAIKELPEEYSGLNWEHLQKVRLAKLKLSRNIK